MYEHEYNEQEENEYYDNLRENLISLSEKGEIKNSISSIKKASKKTLLNIKLKYDTKKLEVFNEAIIKLFLEKLSEFLKKIDVINSEQELARELFSNELLKADLEKLIGYVTPWIPFILQIIS